MFIRALSSPFFGSLFSLRFAEGEDYDRGVASVVKGDSPVWGRRITPWSFMNVGRELGQNLANLSPFRLTASAPSAGRFNRALRGRNRRGWGRGGAKRALGGV